jgi:hypothetical protein
MSPFSIVWISCVELLFLLHVPVVGAAKSELNCVNLSPKMILTPLATVTDPPIVKFWSTITIVKEHSP